jgi:hypothetical protein
MVGCENPVEPELKNELMGIASVSYGQEDKIFFHTTNKVMKIEASERILKYLNDNVPCFCVVNYSKIEKKKIYIIKIIKSQK